MVEKMYVSALPNQNYQQQQHQLHKGKNENAS